MLWYKAWLETRSRFLVALVGTAFFCSWFVLYADREALSYTKTYFYYMVLHKGHALLVMMWILSVTLLMMGGLLRERAAGSSAFTLALPVKRTRLMTVRIAVGLIESLALAVLPWVAMFAVGSIFGKTHSISQAFFHLVLLLGGGMLFLSLAVLASTLIEGEYTAPIVSFGAIILTVFALDKPSLRPYSPLLFMLGNDRIYRGTQLLTGSIPWLQAVAYVSLAALLLVVSVKVIQRREF